jgi:hypothetical protein
MTNYWQTSFINTCKLKIPNRIIKIRPMDKPWMTHDVKIAIRKRNRLYNKHKRNRTQENERKWRHSAKEANYFMNQAKLNHIEKIKASLMDLSIGEKKYWKIAKEVYGSKKVIGIPSLTIGNKTINTSSEKAKYLNEYFTEQQTLPPIAFNQQMPPLLFLTESRLEFIQTSEEEILKLLNSLEVGKANGPDGISNKMLKECGPAIASPLADLFNKSFEMATVPQAWKEANLCPIFKKGDKALVSNYRPISLLPCVAKIQERIVFTKLYRYLITNNLLTSKNSGFRELDSAMNQLLFITDKIYRALEEGKEICLVFLDVFKAFDHVWHSGLLHKTRCMGVEGRLFDWLCNYLDNRKIRVVINGQKSEWLKPNAGVPQGSILGPLLFLIFVNDIVINIESDIHLFADDTSLLEIIENYQESYAKLNRDLDRLNIWAKKWLITFNATKTVYLKVSRKVNPGPKPILLLNGIVIKEVKNHKHLGLTFSDTLSWSEHINNLVLKASRCVGHLRRICREVPRECLEILYKSMIRPILEYGNIIFDGSHDTHLKRLENVQRQAAITCTGAYRHTKHENLLEELGWQPLSHRSRQHRLNIMFKIQRGTAPTYLKNVCPPLTKERTNYNLRSGMNITLPQSKTTTYQKSYFPKTIRDWNALETSVKEIKTLETFKEYHKKKSTYKTNYLYHEGTSRASINHTRMRLGLSGLSSQRKDYNHIDNSKCQRCSALCEDPHHYFILCPVYSVPRVNFLENICQILYDNNIEVEFRSKSFRKFLIQTILKGSLLLNDLENKKIFQITQTYIRETKRFP